MDDEPGPTPDEPILLEEFDDVWLELPNDPCLKGALAIGPDFLGLEVALSTSNIFPSSPDFFMSPPVYGTAVEDIVGVLSFGCSGRPDTYKPLVN